MQIELNKIAFSLHFAWVEGEKYFESFQLVDKIWEELCIWVALYIEHCHFFFFSTKQIGSNLWFQIHQVLKQV